MASTNAQGFTPEQMSKYAEDRAYQQAGEAKQSQINQAVAARPAGTVYDPSSGTYKDPRLGTTYIGSTTGQTNAQGQEQLTPAPGPSGGLRFQQNPTNPVVVSTPKEAMQDLSSKQAFLNNLTQGVANQSAMKAGTNNTWAPPGGFKTELPPTNPAPATAEDTANALSLKFGLGTPEATTTTPTATGTAGAGGTDLEAQMNDLNAKTDQAFQDYQNSINQLRSGTFPLTPDQQAQVDAMNASTQSLIAAQKVANQNYTQGVTQAGITSGQARYSPEIAMGNIQNSISAGLAKVQDIEVKAQTEMTTLRQGFDDRNYAQINASYDKLQSYLKQKSDSITAMQKAIQDEADKTRQYNLDIAKFQQQQQQDSFNNTMASNNADLASKKQAFDEYMQQANLTEKQKQDATDNYYKGVTASLQQAQFALDQKKEAFAESQAADPLGIAAAHPETLNDLVKTGVANQLGTGETFVDISGLPDSKTKAQATKLANQAHLPIISSAAEAQGLTSLDTEQKNLTNLLNLFNQVGPKDATTRLGQAATQWGSLAADTPQAQLIKGYQSLSSTELPSLVKAVSGLNRVNQSELHSASDALPSMAPGSMDTVADAKAKIQNLMQVLSNQKSSMLDNKVVYTDLNDYKNANPENVSYIGDIHNAHPDWSPDDVMQFINSQNGVGQFDTGQSDFNGVGGDTQPADLSKLISAIGQYESGGNYKALGPVIPSGAYEGDRAYGKYQVMGKNIPSWTKQALGYSMTPQQFLADTDAQDKVAEHFIGANLDKYGTPEDVAAVWLSGRPLAGNNASDLATGVTVPQYVKNVMKNYYA